MAQNILILGASYGSLLGMKLAMAGHDVTLVCRPDTARLINAKGAQVRIRLKGEDGHRAIGSTDQPGRLSACAPGEADPSRYDLIALAMQEPQYAAPEIRSLLRRIAARRKPCLSIMNKPPLPYLRRIKGLDADALIPAYTDASVWDGFEPGLMSLCSPDPQAFRPAGGAPNVLHVGLPTNFKAAGFANPDHTLMLARLAKDIEDVRLDGREVPVKLRVHRSLFAPLAKWAMLCAGNYRCVTLGGTRPIRDAVTSDPALSASVYRFVTEVARRLGANPADAVAFEKYAAAAQSLIKPSSATRAIDAGVDRIERVDHLVQLIAADLGMAHPLLDATVDVVNTRLARNEEARLADEIRAA